MAKLDATDPVLFPVGRPIECTPTRRLDMYGVVGYWPKGGWWTVFRSWGETREAAEEYAKEKAEMGWLRCQVICLEQARDEE